MAEAIGLIASVVQVAGAGLKLSQTLYQYADGVATADRRIKDIAKEIELTSGVIDELGDIFKQDETASLISKNAVKTANETMNECSVVFAEIEATLVKSKKGRMGRLMLPFRDNKIDLLRSHIDKLKDTLQLLMQVLTHAHLVSSKKLDREAEAKQREEIKQLLENKKQSTKRYEESLRNFSISDGSTAVDDDQESDKLEENASSLTAALTVAASALASTISPETLAKCVDHVRNLLQNIETLQQALATKVDGDDHSDHHQRAVGSYFRARSHLDSVLLGNSKAGTSNSGGLVPSSFEHVQNGIEVAMPNAAQERSEASDHAGFTEEKARAEERERLRAKAEAREKVTKLAETLVKNETMKGEQRSKEEHEMRVAQAKQQVKLEELRQRAEIEHGELKKRQREARRREIEMGSGPPRPTVPQGLAQPSPVHGPSAPAYLKPLSDGPPTSNAATMRFRLRAKDVEQASSAISQPPARDRTSISSITASEVKPAKTIVKKMTFTHTTEKDATGEKRVGRRRGPLRRPSSRDEAHEIRRLAQSSTGAVSTLLDDEEEEEYQGYDYDGERNSQGCIPTPPANSTTPRVLGPDSTSLLRTPVVVETSDDVSLKRARNTISARESRQRKLNYASTIERGNLELNEKPEVLGERNSPIFRAKPRVSEVHHEMALLLAKTDAPTSPNTIASTFRIDLPEDKEQHLNRQMRSQELVGTPATFIRESVAPHENVLKENSPPLSQPLDPYLPPSDVRPKSRSQMLQDEVDASVRSLQPTDSTTAGSQEAHTASSTIDPPTTHGTGTYLVQQRRPSGSRSRSPTRKVSKPVIIIEFGSNKSRASHSRHTPSVTCSTKAYKRSSLGQSTPSDVPESPSPPAEISVTPVEAALPPTYPKIPDAIPYRPGSLSPYSRTTVDASKPSTGRILHPPVTGLPERPTAYQGSRTASYRTTVVAPTSLESDGKTSTSRDAYSLTPADLRLLGLDAESSTGDEDTALGTSTDEMESLPTTQHIPNSPRPLSPLVYQSTSQDATELSSYGAHMDIPRSRYDLQHNVPMVDLQDDEAWYTKRSTTAEASSVASYPQSPESNNSNNPWLNIMANPLSPTPAASREEENETDEFGELAMSRSTTPTISSITTGLCSGFVKPPTLARVEAKEDWTDEVDGTSLHTTPDNMDISLGLLEQLAENEVSINDPSELDFFTRGAGISPSTARKKGAGEEMGDEVDELLREWTTVFA